MTTSRLPKSLCDDADYIAMRRERMALSGLSSAQAADLLSRDCPASPWRHNQRLQPTAVTSMAQSGRMAAAAKRGRWTDRTGSEWRM
jgi:hypothetical protein